MPAHGARELELYFQGSLYEFTVPVDLRLTGFRGQVTKHLATIGYGEHHTYGDIARALENPGVVRAVGSACARNPIPLFLACHRVIRSGGSPGQYRGGPETKAFLLTHA